MLARMRPGMLAVCKASITMGETKRTARIMHAARMGYRISQGFLVKGRYSLTKLPTQVKAIMENSNTPRE